ncbi:hypothetical protein PIROE2DRAFT_16099 [Piromyces sp. E2]|nr:hypothetical protein PIROE2DRAFT_16099 [Piromyces sp. E2]|eukprot:OUM58573.1 hypothetical protein PIROE2DRAFT_16099 [Piromyces sp. E2]
MSSLSNISIDKDISECQSESIVKQKSKSMDIDNESLFSNLEPNSKENDYHSNKDSTMTVSAETPANEFNQSNTDLMNDQSSIVSLSKSNPSSTIASSNSKSSLKSIIKAPSPNFDDRIRQVDDESKNTNHPGKKKIIRKVKRIIINKKTGEKREVIDNFVIIVGEKEGKALIKKKKMASLKSNGSSCSLCSLYENKKLYPDDNKKYKVIKKTVKVTKKKDYSGELDLDEEELKKIEDERKLEEKEKEKIKKRAFWKYIQS